MVTGVLQDISERFGVNLIHLIALLGLSFAIWFKIEASMEKQLAVQQEMFNRIVVRLENQMTRHELEPWHPKSAVHVPTIIAQLDVQGNAIDRIEKKLDAFAEKSETRFETYRAKTEKDVASFYRNYGGVLEVLKRNQEIR